jgi:hypothetical protein
MATPIEQEQIRQEELAAAQKQSAQANQKTVDVTLIPMLPLRIKNQKEQLNYLH